MVLRNRVTNFIWEMIIVYDPTHHDLIIDFIAELPRKCLYATLPVMLVGDFNVIRHSSEKNNSNVNQNLMDKFNMFIDAHRLQEIRRNGPKYTWTNKQLLPIMVTLGRILISTEWELKHSLCFAWRKNRVGSDHCPLLIDTREQSGNKQSFFYFEN
jgi:endonuclease/exonuclease/phosphatase family metal-dependent hydrolase